jgi:hypothetical protein
MGRGAHIKRLQLMSNSMSSLGHVGMVSFFYQLPTAVPHLPNSFNDETKAFAPELDGHHNLNFAKLKQAKLKLKLYTT